jgi:hypothetical protein
MQSRCPSIEAIAAFIAGGSLPAERALMDKHLRECAICAALLDVVRQSASLVPEKDDDPGDNRCQS